MKLTAESTVFNDDKVQSKFAELVVDADGIRTEVGKKVGNTEVISRINQSAESVKIQADKVNIEGAAIFTGSGRLSETSLDNAYDANGAATGAVNTLTNDLASASGTTIINGGHIATNSIGANKIKVDELTIGQSQVSGLSTDLANTEKLYKHDVDLTGSSYNQDTWYPVLIGPCPATDASIYFKCSITAGGGTPSWSSHSTKHWACEVEASYSASAWGWKSDNNSYIDAYTFGQTSTKPIVLSNALSNSSYLVVYLRGGGYYPIQTNIADTPQIKTSSYTQNSQTVAPTTTQPENTTNFVISRREGDTKTNDAATKATNYIAADSSGIRIASANPATQYQRMELTSSEASLYSSDNLKRVSVNSSTGAIIGRSDKGHTQVTDDGLYIYDVNNKNRSAVTKDGLNVLDTDGSTSVSLFGASVRIGKASGARAETTATGLDIYNSSNQKKASYGATQYIYGGNGTYPYMAADGNGVGIYQSNTQKTIMSSGGLNVYSGDASNAVASFGSSIRVGKVGQKNIQITNTNLNVYDDDGSVPFQVSTATSSSSQAYTIAWYIKASSSYSTSAYFKGNIVDNKISVGVATSGVPTASNTVTLTNAGTEYTITVSGVKYTFTRYTGILIYKIENTNTAKRSCLVSFTQSYKETFVRENTHILDTRWQTVSIEDITGTCYSSNLYTYAGVAQLTLRVYHGSSSVSNGGLIYKGRLGGLVPIYDCYMVGHLNGVYAVSGVINNQGEIFVYNTSGASRTVSSSNYASLSATYLLDQ